MIFHRFACGSWSKTTGVFGCENVLYPPQVLFQQENRMQKCGLSADSKGFSTLRFSPGFCRLRQEQQGMLPFHGFFACRDGTSSGIACSQNW